MTISDSVPGARECFVYLQLPSTGTVVTAGRFWQEEAGEGTIGRFIYGRLYRERADAVAIDPYNLPLSNRPFLTAKLGGIPGALRDSAPDAWGRRVIERALGRTDLTEIDYLLHSPEDHAGALSFGASRTAPTPVNAYNRIVRLPELLATAEHLTDDPAGLRLPPALRNAETLLRQGGTSMGGARPKNVVEDTDGLWIAKFPDRADLWTNAVVEGGLLALASHCGIRTPETRIETIGDRRILLVRRFDRERIADDPIKSAGWLRHRMVSALTVLDAEDSPLARENWSYLLLADELRRWSRRPREDREELFRRMVFNALVSNLDDHPRNHALIAPGAQWELAPAYDLTPEPQPGRHERDLAMICGTSGRRARRSNLVSGATRFGLDRESADAIVTEIKATVAARWEEQMRALGATADECTMIAPAFVDEGFEYD
jgi:serine/threonine-protein kinase HipA